MEDCRSKILGKENIFFDLPSPPPILGGGNDTNDVIVAAACAHQQVLMQDILSKTIERQIWRKVHSRDFWQACRRNWDDGDFITNLREDRGTFLLIVDRLTPYIHRETTRMRQSIEVDERVAMALWRYGSEDSARTIAWMFGVGESTCSEVCLEVAQSICEEFAHNFWELPLMKPSSDKPSSLKLGLVQGTAPTFQFGALLQIERFYGASKGFILLFYKSSLVRTIGFFLLLWDMQEILMTQQS